MISSSSYSQYYDPNAAANTAKTPPPNKGWDWKKVYPGGNVGLGFSSNYFYIEASPLAGYWVNNWFTPGLMLTYIYFTSKITLIDPSAPNGLRKEDFSSSIIGLSPFARAFILKWLFAHIETGVFYAKGYNTDTDRQKYFGQESKFVFSPMVGGGLNFGFGQRGGFTMMLLFNLNYDRTFITYGCNQPYVARIGFYF